MIHKYDSQFILSFLSERLAQYGFNTTAILKQLIWSNIYVHDTS